MADSADARARDASNTGRNARRSRSAGCRTTEPVGAARPTGHGRSGAGCRTRTRAKSQRTANNCASGGGASNSETGGRSNDGSRAQLRCAGDKTGCDAGAKDAEHEDRQRAENGGRGLLQRNIAAREGSGKGAKKG